MHSKVAGLEELDNISSWILENLGDKKVIIFHAEMGAGKTTLIKSICRKLGVSDVVSSPTFSLVNEYMTDKGESIFHFDFYRIESLSEVYDMGFEEYLESGSLCLIEWPEKVQDILPETVVEIQIETEDLKRTYQLVHK